MKLIRFTDNKHRIIGLHYLNVLLDFNRNDNAHISLTIEINKLNKTIKKKLGSYQMQINRKSPYFIRENYVYGKGLLLKKLILDYNLGIDAQIDLKTKLVGKYSLHKVKIPQLSNYKSLHHKHNFIESFFDHTEFISPIIYKFDLDNAKQLNKRLLGQWPQPDYIEEEEDLLAIWKEIEEQEEAQIEESTYLQETLGLKPITDTHLASHHYKKYMPLIPDYKEEDDPDTWYNHAIKEKEERDSSIAQQREELDNYYSSLPPTHHYINKNKRRKDGTQLFD